MSKILELLNEDNDMNEDRLQKTRDRCYKYLISPNNTRLMQFNLLVAMTGYVDMILSVYYLCFFGSKPLESLVPALWVFTGIYIIDIILRFFTKVKETTYMESNVFKIAQSYLKGYFVFDVMSLAPFYLPLRLARLARIRQHGWTIAIAVGALLIRFIEMRNATQLACIRFARFVLTLIITVHIFGSVFCGLGENGWIIEKEELIRNSSVVTNVDIYIAGIYWVLLTFTTVGYGQVAAVTEAEMIYCFIIQFVGIVFFVDFMGNLYSILENAQGLSNYKI